MHKTELSSSNLTNDRLVIALIFSRKTISALHASPSDYMANTVVDTGQTCSNY